MDPAGTAAALRDSMDRRRTAVSAPRPTSPKPHTLPPVSAAVVAKNTTDLLSAYKQFHKDKRIQAKAQQRISILAAKPPPIIASLPPSQDPGLRMARDRISAKSFNLASSSLPEQRASPNVPPANGVKQDLMDEYNFSPDEIKAIIKTQCAIRRHLAKKKVLAMAKPAEYVRFVCERLFDECCRTEPLPDGMSTHEDGYIVVGGPNLPRILRILEDPTNINLDLLQKHTIDRITVAHAACQRGYLELLSLLVAFWSTQPPSSDRCEESSHTTLLYKLLDQVNQAKREGKLLRECGLDVIETIKALGLAPDYVFNAIDQFHFKDVTLQDMFKICGHPIVRARDVHGNTPLHYAAEGGYVNVCEFLLEHGAYINEQNVRGEAPLHFAISSMHESVCELLVRRKADVTIARYRAVELDTGQRLRGVIVTAPAGEEQCQMLAEGAAVLAKARKPNTDVKPATPATKRVSPGKTTTRFVQATVGVCMRQFDHDDPRLGEMVFFRLAPSLEDTRNRNSPLVIFYIGTHISMPRYKIALARQSQTKILHLLIVNMPKVAYMAIDHFRTPLFRCRVVPGIRTVGQSWHTEGWLSNDDRRKKLVHKMKQKGPPVRKAPRRRKWLFYMYQAILKCWAFVLGHRPKRRYRKTDSVIMDTVLQAVGKSTGIVYEYRYESETSSGSSPTFELIIKSECKELMAHPWVQKLRDHKWNIFARKHFMRQLRVYMLFFSSYFLSIVLLVGDTSIGLKEGGYQAPLFGTMAGPLDYLRAIASFICLIFTAQYTWRHIQEIYRGGWLLFFTYCANIWNIFDMVLLCGIWFTTILDFIVYFRASPVAWDTWSASAFIYEDHFRVKTYQESTFNVVLYREYDWHTTIMCITAPQIFIRWLQFCRGNQTLGPFVRMIYQMMGDIAMFLFVFVLFLFGFAFAFYVLQLNGFRTLMSSTNSVYQMSLGQWDWASISAGGPVAVMLYILYTCFGTIMMLNLLVAMLGRTYEDIWDDRLLFFHLERSQTILTVQHKIDPDKYRRKYWCQTLYALEGDAAIQGIPYQHFDD
ncbi:hypothetical protein H310_02632 [Aphanomyces invadans]|uniref:Ion transport domain-containing protein n=1 Tax=Aphanomyces invadans TaxID=157072 RepID=A0A024UKH3_9STRA|nr:hypothetical protein H310_02632 [Aphanomyces invadans]ETW06352.1 hypothetical protein H310_02632 [Aphanomyces invadans]|eukprot:XP_008864427.1 hypothetical protein H310_02632 [Aphanomyces invadans]